jgi:hypothetical protein
MPEWEIDVTSEPVAFEVVRGAKLWEQEFGVPPLEGNAATRPEMRRYALQQANYRKQLQLYVRVTDASEATVYRVFPLSPMVSFSRPEAQVDKQGRLHVLNQAGARACVYCIIDPDGRVLVRQTYDVAQNSRPSLAADKDGLIQVKGGVRRAMPDDFPPPVPPPDVEAKSELKP